MGADVKLPVLTNSQMKCFRRCAREHHYAYGLGYRSAQEAENLRFGSLVHAALEAWWIAAGSGGDRLAAAFEAIAAAGDSDAFERVRAEEMMLGYTARWADESYEVVGVEEEFRAPLINPETGSPSRTFELGGKLDVRVRRDGDRIVEHKTTTEDVGPGSSYWERLKIDGQISTYYAGARELGHDVVGCVYDVLTKPSLRPLKATPPDARKYTKQGALYANQREADETPEEYRARIREHITENPDRYYQRGDVVRLESEEREAAFDTWQTARLIREAELANRHPRNPDACVRYGRTCDFFGVCTGSASLDDITLFRRVDNIHEELTQDTQPTTEAA